MSDKESENEQLFTGLGVSNGTAYGKVFVVAHTNAQIPEYNVSDSQIDGEIKRFEQALMKTRTDIVSLKEELAQKVGEEESSIFDAHLLVLEDVAIINETYSNLQSTKRNIEICYIEVVNRFLQAFEEIDDPFMRERIADIRDVSRRMINNLMGHEEKSSLNLGEPAILASKDFTPSDFAFVDKTKVLGIITEKGSLTSHTAILARSLRVPCIVGINIEETNLKSGDVILIDGYKGNLFVRPSNDTLKKYTEIANIHREIERIFDSSLPYPSETTDARRVSLEFNIGSALDIKEGSMSYSDGIGLFRTEALFIDKGSFMDEESQFEAYKAAVIKAEGKPVTIRTLDLGGDKTLAFKNEFGHEENPFMGYRAIRFCLDRVDIFTAQLKAILRAGVYGKVRILYPMISGINELVRANSVLEQAKLALKNEGIEYSNDIEIGAMIEVPSAAMIIDLIAKHCDFISIGTNDLIQYLLAVDRVNDHVAHLYNPANPAVIRMLDKIVSEGKKANLKVSVCGEIAADPIFAMLLIGMGVDSLSMASGALSEIKFLLRKVSFEELRKLRGDALSQNCSRDILTILRRFRNAKMKEFIQI
ncbi:MAG: phosphoenolpyruvate--protein phosphotransferase [Opitutales bacterium]|nr:phosphoenolpyruvate--protein phosphotransferase [Opitutales bacterium]